MSTTTIEPEILESQSEALDLRHPATPTTLNELAARTGEGIQIIRARAEILQVVRQASIKATSAEDWLLFRDKAGATIGYLQDCGCDRVVGLWGIEIFNVSTPEKIIAPDLTFMYILRGSGRCALTGQTVQDVEGGRQSTDDFCKDKTGAALELAVRKAARANLDGNIVRALTGLQSVPDKEIKGAGLDITKCRHGRGFGSGAERAGADVYVAPGVKQSESPKCPKCSGETKFMPAGKTQQGRSYEAFWACRKGKDKCGGTLPFKKNTAGVSETADFKAKLNELAIDAGVTPTELDEWIDGRTNGQPLTRDVYEVIKADLKSMAAERQA